MTDTYFEEDITSHLIRMGKHANPNIRAGIAVALGRIGSSEAVDMLLEMLNDPVYQVHRNAARAIGMLGVSGVGTVLAVLQESTDLTTRRRLADSIGFIRDPDAVEILSAALNYLEPPAQYGVIDALGEIGDEQAVPALVQSSRSDDPITRLKSAQALLNIRAPEALHALAALLDESDPRLRVPAIEGLGRIGSEAAVLSLLSLLNDEDETVSYATADALREIHTPEALDVFLTTINSPSSWVQKTIAEVLGNYPEARVVERLMALLTEQGDLETRLSAAQSLTRIGDERGKAMILRTLNAPNVMTRQYAAIALGMTGDMRAVEPFLQTIRQRPIDPGTPRGRNMRRRMITAMTRIGAPVIEKMIDLLADKDSFVKLLAWDVLLEFSEAAVDPLILAMQVHRNREVRVEAVHLLGRIGDERAIEPLSDILRAPLMGPYPVVFLMRLFFDRSAPLRIAAAKALGRIGSQEGVSLLISAARFDPEKGVNEAAEIAIARIGSPTGLIRLSQGAATGLVHHALASGGIMLLIGAVTALISRVWGVADAAVLFGLMSGAVYGAVDGLEGRKRSAQGALLGAAAATVAAWLLSGVGSPWVVSASGFVFPVLGTMLGWDKVTPLQRMAGLFGGMVLGFAGAGLMLLILGTIN